LSDLRFKAGRQPLQAGMQNLRLFSELCGFLLTGFCFFQAADDFLVTCTKYSCQMSCRAGMLPLATFFSLLFVTIGGVGATIFLEVPEVAQPNG
jgi:hypothetical protein